MPEIRNSKGMTLLELLMGSLVILVLIALISVQVRGVLQRAKVSAAKATLDAFATCLAMIKDDTGYYPQSWRLDPEDKTIPPLGFIREATPPQSLTDAGLRSMDWCGPYAETLALKDPWGTYYFYDLQTTLLDEECETQTGGHYQDTFFFDCTTATAILVIDNPGGVTSGEIKLNGTQIVSANDFKRITPSIVLTIIDPPLISPGENELYVDIGGAPGISIRIGIRANAPSKELIFVLLSYGKDGEDVDLNTTSIVYGTY